MDDVDPGQPDGTAGTADLERQLEQARAEAAQLRRENEELSRRLPGRGPQRSRRAGAVALLLIGCLLAPLALAAVWLRTALTDTDAYVRTGAPLAKDPAIQDAVAVAAGDQLVALLHQQVNVEQEVQAALPPRAQCLAAPLAQGGDSLVRSTVDRVVRSDQFAALWEQSNRVAHKQVTGLLLGRTDDPTQALAARNGVVTLDLSVVIGQVKRLLLDEGFTLASKIPDGVGGTLTLMDSEQVARASRGARLLDQLGVVLPLLVLALLAGGVALATDHRKALLRA